MLSINDKVLVQCTRCNGKGNVGNVQCSACHGDGHQAVSLRDIFKLFDKELGRQTSRAARLPGGVGGMRF